MTIDVPKVSRLGELTLNPGSAGGEFWDFNY